MKRRIEKQQQRKNGHGDIPPRSYQRVAWKPDITVSESGEGAGRKALKAHKRSPAMAAGVTDAHMSCSTGRSPCTTAGSAWTVQEADSRVIGSTYRWLEKRDVSAIARVHRRACLIAYKFMNWSYSEDAVREWYAHEFAGWDWGLVAEADSTVVGFVATQGAHIDQLFVDPDYQRRGIGTSMLTATLQRMPSLVTLIVFEENKQARRFYEKHDFRPAGGFFNETERAVELVYRRDGNSN